MLQSNIRFRTIPNSTLNLYSDFPYESRFSKVNFSIT